jgi:hypothetical protein
MMGMDKKKIILEQIERLLEHHPHNERDIFYLSFDGYVVLSFSVDDNGIVTLEEAYVDGQFSIDLNRI